MTVDIEADEQFAAVSGSMFKLILAMDDARGALGERLGISVTGLKSLSLINRLGPSSAGVLATAAGVTSGSMTATIDKLSECGYVTRQRSTTDGRSVLVVITPSGKRAADWVIEHYWKAVQAAIPGPQHAPIIGRFLAETAVNLNALVESVPPWRD